MEKASFSNSELLPGDILHEILQRVIAIEQLLHVHQPNQIEETPVDDLPEINWTASKTDLVELIYALHAHKVFNHGSVSINTIARYFEKALAIKLGNTSLRFQEILRRKESLAFLQQIQLALSSYISRLDERNQ